MTEWILVGIVLFFGVNWLIMILTRDSADRIMNDGRHAPDHWRCPFHKWPYQDCPICQEARQR